MRRLQNVLGLLPYRSPSPERKSLHAYSARVECTLSPTWLRSTLRTRSLETCPVFGVNTLEPVRAVSIRLAALLFYSLAGASSPTLHRCFHTTRSWTSRQMSLRERISIILVSFLVGLTILLARDVFWLRIYPKLITLIPWAFRTYRSPRILYPTHSSNSRFTIAIWLSHQNHATFQCHAKAGSGTRHTNRREA